MGLVIDSKGGLTYEYLENSDIYKVITLNNATHRIYEEANKK